MTCPAAPQPPPGQAQPGPAGQPEKRAGLARLKRDLGTLEAYAALIGILVGAGIFKVTSEASARTGPGVVLGYILLAPAILATSVAYAVFLSTSLGRQPGGDYGHIARTFGGTRVAFLAAWMKLISYVGAAAYLAAALADYGLALPSALGVDVGDPSAWRLPIALTCLGFFGWVQLAGVRWFGRLQVSMCAVLGVSILVLVVPGLFAVKRANFTPLLPNGWSGLGLALPPLFFAFAGFEAIAHAGGEMRDSTRRLPRVFLFGIAASTVIFVLMSFVAFGVLPSAELAASAAPMARVAEAYLPFGAAALVTLGGVLAVATSLNTTLLVPGRLGLVLAQEGLLPRFLGAVNADRGTPVVGTLVTLGIAAFFLLSGQVAMTLNVAIFALVSVYALHSLALLVLPRANPALFAEIDVPLGRRAQVVCASFSLLCMLILIGLQMVQDVEHIGQTSLAQRFAGQSVTSLELLGLWGLVGLVCRRLSRGRSDAAIG